MTHAFCLLISEFGKWTFATLLHAQNSWDIIAVCAKYGLLLGSKKGAIVVWAVTLPSK